MFYPYKGKRFAKGAGVIIFVRSKTAFGKYVRFRDLPVLENIRLSSAWVDGDVVIADIGHCSLEELPAVVFGGTPPPTWLDFIEVLQIGPDAGTARPLVDEVRQEEVEEEPALEEDEDQRETLTTTSLVESPDNEEAFELDWVPEYDPDDWSMSSPPVRYVARHPSATIVAALSPKGEAEKPTFGRKLLAVLFEDDVIDAQIAAVRKHLDGFLKGKHPAFVWHGRRVIGVAFVDERLAKFVVEQLATILETEAVFDYFVVQPTAVLMVGELSPLKGWLDSGFKPLARRSASVQWSGRARRGAGEVFRRHRKTAARPDNVVPVPRERTSDTSRSQGPLTLRRLTTEELKARQRAAAEDLEARNGMSDWPKRKKPDHSG